MMPLNCVVAALVTDLAAEAQFRKDALVAAGADVRVCSSPHELGAILTSEVIDAVIIGEMSSACAQATALGVLRQEYRARTLAVLILAPEETRLADLSVLGELVSVLSAAAPDVALVEGLVRLLGPFARANEAIQERVALNEKLAVRAAALEAVRGATRAFAHDSGVFLGIVVGFACNLRDQIVGPLLPAQTEHVHRILDAANSAAKMLEAHCSSEVFDRDSIDGPSVSTSRKFNRRMLVDVKTIAEQVVMLLSDTARQAGVTLTFSAEEPIHVWGDALHLKQVALNLVSNALKFTPRGGRVEVTVRPALAVVPPENVGGPAARKRVEIVVRDTGPGVPVEDRERIFGHGVRLSRDATTPGSGIGLGVVRELVALHDGTVKVEDRSGEGAVFVVSLPIDRRQRAGERSPSSSIPPSTSRGEGSS